MTWPPPTWDVIAGIIYGMPKYITKNDMTNVFTAKPNDDVPFWSCDVGVEWVAATRHAIMIDRTDA